MSEIIIENGSVEHQWILLLSIFSNMFYFDERRNTDTSIYISKNLLISKPLRNM